MERKKKSPLLELLNERRAWEGPEHKVPAYQGPQLARIAVLVDEHAKANNSDPFARARKLLHVMRGIDGLARTIVWKFGAVGP